MLKLSLPKLEIWNNETEEFDDIGGVDVELEHSLYTVSQWEAKWKIPFASKKGLTKEQLLDYVMSFMCQTENVPKEAWVTLTQENLEAIQAYLEDPACATTVKRHAVGPTKSFNSETVTAELIYFYMTQFGIPFECEHWHLNKLMKLIDVCAVKNAPSKKMGKKEAMQMWAEQNARMKAKTGSRG